jgi:hypothetical protein
MLVDVTRKQTAAQGKKEALTTLWAKLSSCVRIDCFCLLQRRDELAGLAPDTRLAAPA